VAEPVSPDATTLVLRVARRARAERRRARVHLRHRARSLWRHIHGVRASTYTTTLRHVRTRDQIPELLNRRGLLGTGVEIGVKRGRYSEFLLAHWRGRRLISVDPWQEYPKESDSGRVYQWPFEQLYVDTQHRLARFGDRSEIWRTTSVEAAERVDLASVDFLYIDARHDHDSVLEDIEAWYPKVRPGGIIAGHDYTNRDRKGWGVKSAVDEFFGARGLHVHVTAGRPRVVESHASWIVALPED
jgi:hypothetical protein